MNALDISLFVEWQKANKPNLLKRACGWVVVAMLILLPADFIFFPINTALTYSPFRIVTILVYFCTSLYGRELVKQSKSLPKKIDILLSVLIITLTFVLLLQYLYFLLTAESMHYPIVNGGIFMVIFSGIYLTRFYILENTVFLFLSLITFIGLQFVDLNNMSISLPQAHSQTKDMIKNYILWIIFLFIIFRSQVPNFKKELAEQFNSFVSIAPLNWAKHSVLYSGLSIREVFKPIIQPISCIVIDWRSFQVLANDYPSEFVQILLEQYHSEILKIIDQAIPDRTYYASWNADELFFVIFSDQKDSNEVQSKTLEFLKLLGSESRSSLSSKKDVIQRNLSNKNLKIKHIPIPIIDIGCAFGSGDLCGIMGPETMMRVTSIGKVGGYAKRFETVSKEIRSKINDGNPHPILTIDSQMKTYIDRYDPDFSDVFNEVDTTEFNVKNLAHVQTYFYQFCRRSRSEIETAAS